MDHPQVEENKYERPNNQGCSKPNQPKRKTANCNRKPEIQTKSRVFGLVWFFLQKPNSLVWFQFLAENPNQTEPNHIFTYYIFVLIFILVRVTLLIRCGLFDMQLLETKGEELDDQNHYSYVLLELLLQHIFMNYLDLLTVLCFYVLLELLLQQIFMNYLNYLTALCFYTLFS